MNKIAKRLARKILTHNKLYTTPTCQELQKIIEENGFVIVPYKKYNNSDEISECINKLNLQNKIQQHDSFIYVNNNLKLVFINSDLSTQDKCSLLFHELGHIVDPNLLSSDLSYSKIQREEFANTFSYHIQHPGTSVKLLSLLSLKSVIITTLAILAFLICGIGLYHNHIHSEIPTATVEISEETPMYFVTSSGEKYHKDFCIIVKYRNNICAHPLDELKNKGYKPCLLCIGEQ